MGSTTKVLCVAGTLLAAGLHAAPAEAAPAAPGAVVSKTCTKTADGVQVKVRMRFDMRTATDLNRVQFHRVRVSHPDGVGAYRSNQVRSVATTLVYESEASNPRLGSAAWAERRGDRPAYNKWLRMEMGSVTAVVTFRLRNGERMTITCAERFPSD